MASPRHSRFALRALLLGLACAQFSVVPLMAHPTKTIVRSSTRRLVIASPPREHLRERAVTRRHLGKPLATRHAAPAKANALSSMSAFKTPAHVSLRTSPNSGSGLVGASDRATAQPQSSPVDPAAVDRVRAWEQAQREAAIQSSVAAADAELASLDGDPANSSGKSGSAQTGLSASLDLPSGNSIASDAPRENSLPSLRPLLFYDSLGRLVVPPPLYGSHEVLIHQNQMADRDGLTRIQNDAGLNELLRQRKLVPLPVDETLRVDYRLPENRRYSRPWTARFLAALAHDHFAAFHSPIQVDSAVRTVQVQRRLMRTNGNAAPTTGETASPHLTGQAIDIAKSSLTLTEIAWMRAYLQPLIEAGKIDVEEEFQQACFHISVYKDYLPATPPHVTMAVTHPSQSPAAY